jgi:methylmalonyl-CoA mutase
VDNSAVKEKQLKRLKEVKAKRDSEAVAKALQKITNVSKGIEKGNLLEMAISAARVRATLGEISMAMEEVFGRHKPLTKTISGVYSRELKNDESFIRVRQKTKDFIELDGRRPRILIAKMGQDGHDRGAKVIATSFADLGFDVDIGSLFSTPKEVALQAVENDVHIIGASSLAGGHKTLVPELIGELKKLGRGDILVVAGGVIPQADYDFLHKAGVADVFGPGTIISKAAEKIVDRLSAELKD